MKYVVLDVREPEEYAAEHLADSRNVPVGDIVNGTADLSDIPKDAEIITYCRSGNRSETAKQALHAQGYTNVVNGINLGEAARLMNL